MMSVRRTLLALLAIAVLVVAAGALYVRHWLAQPLTLYWALRNFSSKGGSSRPTSMT